MESLTEFYVIQCKPLREQQAAAALQDLLGLTTYLPRIKRRLHSRLQFAPFFPGYLFVRANLTEMTVQDLSTVPGVVRLVAFGDVPQPVPVAIIEALRERVDQLNAAGGLRRPDFHPGDPVSVTQGPLRGLEALFIKHMKPGDRARVLIEFLGELREAEIDVAMLEPAAAPEPEHPERRTRGRGRKIRNQYSVS